MVKNTFSLVQETAGRTKVNLSECPSPIANHSEESLSNLQHLKIHGDDSVNQCNLQEAVLIIEIRSPFSTTAPVWI